MRPESLQPYTERSVQCKVVGSQVSLDGALLGVRSAIRRHQPPLRTALCGG